MKRAILSCIHGNLEAFDAVLLDLERQGAEAIHCLGDLVGYGPYPNEVVERVRSLAIPTVQGCWDEDIVEGLNACECSYPSLLAERRGRLAHRWTDQILTADNRAFLAQLPVSLAVDTAAGRLVFVHGSPSSAHEYLLAEMDAFMALERVLGAGADVLFCGHTHIPYARSLDGIQLRTAIAEAPDQGSIPGETLPMDHTVTVPVRHLINAGSVGEPRHGRPHATYVLFDDESGAVDLREVPYAVDKTCAAILERGLPMIFAWRLAKGLDYAERAEDASHVCAR
ncbi:MAG: metallophosphoesterase family protein [Cyanophyceae cyanobacterium]